MILFTLPQLKYLEKELLNPSLRKGLFKLDRFKNEELYVQIETTVANEHCLILGTIAPPEENLVSVILLSHTLKKEGANKITAIFPYLAYTRHDKEKPGEDLATAAVGQIFRVSGINEIWTIDVHSDLDEILFPIRLVSLQTDELFANLIRDTQLQDATLVAPDDGSISRCEAVRSRLKMKPVAYFHKQRDHEIVTGSLVGAVSEKVVIIDDILDTGTTLIEASKKLRMIGVKEIYIMVSHGLFTGKNWTKLWELGVQKIFCTNSTLLKGDLLSKQIEQLNIGPLLWKKLN